MTRLRPPRVARKEHPNEHLWPALGTPLVRPNRGPDSLLPGMGLFSNLRHFIGLAQGL